MKKKNPEKKIKLLEIIALFILFIMILIFKMIPEYKSTLGSSDTFVDSKSYTTLVEIKVKNGPNFMLVTEEKKITNIIFLNEEALCLYNQQFENLSIQKGLPEITNQLVNQNLLVSNSIVEVIEYPKNKEYSLIKEAFNKNIKKNNLSISYLETQSTLEQKLKDLDISPSEDSSELKVVELYSKELVRKNKNNISTATGKTNLTTPLAEKYIKHIYSKLETYAKTVENQVRDDMALPIQLIPVSNDIELYPTEDSWYYIKNHQVYAYIKITNNNQSYSYCYQGTKETVKKGEC